MPINELYDNWMRQICELRPKQRIAQVRNFVWLLIGIYESHSVCLSKIAGKIPGPAMLVSSTRRLSRFLDNPAVDVRERYQPIAQQWLQAQWRCLGKIRLIVDGTKVGFRHQLLMVSLWPIASGPFPLRGPGSSTSGVTVVPSNNWPC